MPFVSKSSSARALAVPVSHDNWQLCGRWVAEPIVPCLPRCSHRPRLMRAAAWWACGPGSCMALPMLAAAWWVCGSNPSLHLHSTEHPACYPTSCCARPCALPACLPACLAARTRVHAHTSLPVGLCARSVYQGPARSGGHGPEVRIQPEAAPRAAGRDAGEPGACMVAWWWLVRLVRACLGHTQQPGDGNGAHVCMCVLVIQGLEGVGLVIWRQRVCLGHAAWQRALCTSCNVQACTCCVSGVCVQEWTVGLLSACENAVRLWGVLECAEAAGCLSMQAGLLARTLRVCCARVGMQVVPQIKGVASLESQPLQPAS